MIQVEKLPNIYKWLLSNNDSILELNDNDKFNKFVIKFNFDKNDIFSDENYNYIALVHDKSTNIYYITFKGLTSLMSDNKFNDIKETFIEKYYHQKNDNILNKSLIDEIDEIYDELNPLAPTSSRLNSPFDLTNFTHELENIAREQEHRERRRREEELRARDYMDLVTQPGFRDNSILNTASNDEDTISKLRRIFPIL